MRRIKVPLRSPIFWGWFCIFSYVTTSQPRLCSRPLCANDAEVLLLFDYETRLVELKAINKTRDSNLMELCAIHADRFRPPQGWSCQDEREPKRNADRLGRQYAFRDQLNIF
ncbi:MAG TPA: hypothetical protein DHV80_01845 [Acidimicrobiaceae bacterium]|nr:hypothetical protein [Acidimicrobiaceae bacterium]